MFCYMIWILPIPRQKDKLVKRPRLIDLFPLSRFRKLNLVTAPAGFGKTTIVNECEAGVGP